MEEVKMTEEKKVKTSCMHNEEKLCMYLLSIFVIGAVTSVLGINIDQQLKKFNNFAIFAVISLIIMVNIVHKKRKALKDKDMYFEYSNVDILNVMLLFVGLISIHNRVTCEIIVLCNFVIEQLLRRFKYWQY